MDITFFTLPIFLANMPKICANVCEQSLTLTFESVIKASVLIVSTAFSSLPFRAVTPHSEFVYSREREKKHKSPSVVCSREAHAILGRFFGRYAEFAVTPEPRQQ